MQAAKRTPVDLREWAVGLMERDNRKSHLAPQLSPATQELLRSTDSPTYHGDDRTLETPTSGEIPILSTIVSPRDQQYDSISNRTGGFGRASGPAIHPGLGPRVATTNSIPRAPTGAVDYAGPASANRATFTLPVRPVPPRDPLPPPPPRKETQEERDSRRQALHGSYGLGYPAK